MKEPNPEAHEKTLAGNRELRAECALTVLRILVAQARTQDTLRQAFMRLEAAATTSRQSLERAASASAPTMETWYQGNGNDHFSARNRGRERPNTGQQSPP